MQKHTSEDNGDIESFRISLKTDYIWINDLESFEDAGKLMEYALSYYNTVRPHPLIILRPMNWKGDCVMKTASGIYS